MGKTIMRYHGPEVCRNCGGRVRDGQCEANPYHRYPISPPPADIRGYLKWGCREHQPFPLYGCDECWPALASSEREVTA